jgi:hypothetical protein
MRLAKFMRVSSAQRTIFCKEWLPGPDSNQRPTG